MTNLENVGLAEPEQEDDEVVRFSVLASRHARWRRHGRRRGPRDDVEQERAALLSVIVGSV